MTGPWHDVAFELAPLGRIAEIRLGKMLQPTPLAEGDREVTYLRAGSLATLDRAAEPLTMYASANDEERFAVRTGDLLVAEGGDCGQAALVPEIRPGTIIQNSLHRVRSELADVRYIRYCLSAIYSSDWLDVLCNKSTFGHLTREKLASMLIPNPPAEEQRAIADYLDREAARIDALTAARDQMADRVMERTTLAFDGAVASFGVRLPGSLDPMNPHLPHGWRWVKLSQVLDQLTNGYVGPTRDILVENGVPYIQSLHIKGGKIEFERGAYYVTEEWHRARPRINLKEGDVLIVQTGDIGQTAVVPPSFGPASCHALLIARARRSLLSGPYLAAFLRSPFGQAALLSRATGALHPHLEGGVKSIPVLVPPREVQSQIVESVREAERAADAVLIRLREQVTVLAERRRAVISAAVRGDLPVSVPA